MDERAKLEAARTLVRVRLERAKPLQVLLVVRDERGEPQGMLDMEAPREVVRSALARLSWVLSYRAKQENRRLAEKTCA